MATSVDTVDGEGSVYMDVRPPDEGVTLITARTERTDLLPSLWHSIAATSLMIALPLAVVWLSSWVLYFKLHPVAALFASLALSLVCAVVASRIWERRSRTAEVSFSELMIWSWFRLQRAERRIALGLQAIETARSHEERLQVLNELTLALESKDPYTRGHSRRVERLSFKLGVAMGLPLNDIEVLRMSASLHDVGKIRVPIKLLHKRGALSDEERVVVEEHCVLGSEMVTGFDDGGIVETVRHHHERWDGHGYPDGMAGTDIPLLARLIAVADSYDAIRSTRSYRVGAGRDRAVGILQSESGHQFDPEVVDVFMTTLPARSRVVAVLMSLATGPGALWRYMQQLAHSFGSAALAPALGAVGAAVVIGASTLLTPIGPAQGLRLLEVPNVRSGVGPVAAMGPLSATDPVQGADLDREAAHVRAERRPAPDRSAARKKRHTQEQATVVADSGDSTPTSPSQNEGSTSDTQPASGTTGGADLGSVGDPNVHGRDCKPGLGKNSKGSRLHCR